MSELWDKVKKDARKATFTEVYVTVTGSREVMIENVTHVYECNEIMARVRTRDGDISIWGEELQMGSFREGTVRISGKITSIEMSERSGAKDD